MPVLDGYETLRQIRDVEQRHGRGRLPAIALTAFVQNEDRMRAHDAGFEMHISKPVAIKELIVTIAAFVRERGGS
jgi:CheY-like chemotaxis protein